MILVASLESIIVTLRRDFLYAAISLPSIFIFLGLTKYYRRRIDRLANIILIYYFLTGVRLAFTDINNPAIYLFFFP